MAYQRKALEATDRRLEWFKNDKYAGLEKLTYLGCQLRLKFPHSSGRKSCHPGMVLVYSSSRIG